MKKLPIRVFLGIAHLARGFLDIEFPRRKEQRLRIAAVSVWRGKTAASEKQGKTQKPVSISLLGISCKNKESLSFQP